MSSPKPSRLPRLVKLGVGAGLLVALFGFLAPLVAAPLVRGFAEDALEDALHAEASIGSLSLSWGGDVQVGDVRLVDLQGRPLARVESLEVSIAPLEALGGTFRFDVRVRGVEAHVHQEPDGSWSVQTLLREDTSAGGTDDPGDEDEPGPLALYGPLRLEGGRVVVHAANGGVEVRELEFGARFAGPDVPAEIEGRARVVGEAGGGSVSMRGALPGDPGRLSDVEDLSAFVELTIDDDLELAAFAPLASSLAPVEGLTGVLSGSTRLAVAPGLVVQASGGFEVADLGLRGPREGEAPLRLRRVRLDARTGPAADGVPEATVELLADDAVQLTLRTRSVDDRLTGSADLALGIGRIGELARGWVPLREGLRLEGEGSGSLAFAYDLTSGAGSVEGRLYATELAAFDPARGPIDLADLSTIECVVDAAYTPGPDAGDDTLEVRTLTAGVGPFSLEGRGSLAALDGHTPRLGPSRFRMTANLDEAAGLLASLGDFGTTLGGYVTAQVEASGDEVLGVDAHLDVRELLVGMDGAMPVRYGSLEATANGTLNAVTRTLALDTLGLSMEGLEVAGEMRVDGSGDVPRIAGNLTSTVHPARLPDWVRDLAGADLGGTPLAATLTLAGTPEDLSIRGGVKGDRLRVTLRPDQADTGDGAARASEPTPLVQERLDLAFDVTLTGPSLRVTRLEASSSTGSARVTGDVRWGGEAPQVQVDAGLEANVATLLADLGPLLGPGIAAGGVDAAGDLTSTWSADTTDGIIRVEGDLTVGQFAMSVAPEPGGPPERALRVTDPELRVGLTAAVDPRAARLDLTRLELASGFVSGQMRGRLSGYDTLGQPGSPARLDGVQGEFSYLPDELGVVLSPWLPGTLTGAEREECRFTLEGPLARMARADGPEGAGEDEGLGGLALLEDLRGEVHIGVGRFASSVIELTGDLDVRLADTGTELAGTFAANEGELALAGNLVLSEEGGSTLALDVKDLQANSGLGPVLSYVHPAFAAANSVQGTTIGGILSCDLDLAYSGPLTPRVLAGGWEALPKQHIHGSGTFAIDQAVLRGSPLISELLAKLEVGEEGRFEIRPIQLNVQAGRISYHKPWRWTVSGAETSFTGSVGLDETLALRWSIPITREMAQKNSFLRPLEGTTLDIPIGGTITRPKLELDDLLGDVAKSALKKELGDALGLGGGSDDPGQLLKQADQLWGSGRKKDAAAVYQRIRKEFKLSLVYALNRDRIKERAGYTGP